MVKTCTICSHASRNLIDEAILRNVPLRAIERQFSVGRMALKRHKDAGHISKIAVKAQDARERMSADRLLDTIEVLLSECVRSVADAKANGDLGNKMKAIREARETAKVLLQVQGEIENGNKVQVATQVNVALQNDERQIFLAFVDERFGPADREALVKRLGGVL